MRKDVEVRLGPGDRDWLEAIVADRNSAQKHAWRVPIVLATADGCGAARRGAAEVMRRAGVSTSSPGDRAKPDGTTTLFAALNVLDGSVIGQCMQRHRHQEFLRLLNRLERDVPAGKLVHVVLDNYASHKHPKVRAPRRSPDRRCFAERIIRLLADDGSRGTSAGPSTSRRLRPLA